MEIDRTLRYSFVLTAPPHGLITVTLIATGDDPLAAASSHTMIAADQKIDAWLQDELLPYLNQYPPKRAVSRNGGNRLERTAQVAGPLYTVTCQLKFELAIDGYMDSDEDLKLRTLIWKLLGKSGRHARQEMLLEQQA